MSSWQRFFLTCALGLWGWLWRLPVPAEGGTRPFLVVVLVSSPHGLDQVVKILEQNPTVRLTLVPPEHGWSSSEGASPVPPMAFPPRTSPLPTASPALLQRVKTLARARRIELALGLSARPLLPLLDGTVLVRISTPSSAPTPLAQAGRLDDVKRLLVEGERAFKQTWGLSPQGLVASEGAIDEVLDGEFRRLGFQWIIAALGGPLGNPPVVYHRAPGGEEGRPVYFDGSGCGVQWFEKGSQDPRAWFAELIAMTSSSHPPERSDHSPADRTPITLIFAEVTSPPFPRTQRLPGLNLLMTFLEVAHGGETTSRGAGDALSSKWITPSQWVGKAGPVAVWQGQAAEVFGLRSWDAPDLSRWLGHPAQLAAWRRYAECREAVQRYEDSGHADPKRVQAALAELKPLIAAEWFEWFGQDEAVVERQLAERYFTAALVHTYRLIAQTPPAELDEPLGRSGVPLHSILTPGATPYARGPLDVPNRIEFRDAIGDSQGFGALDLVSLTVSWDETGYRFAIQLRDPAQAGLPPFGWDGVVMDVYLDVNHRTGAGTVPLLPGRNAFTTPQDAWEYALTLMAGKASLYRTQGSRGSGDPVKIAELPVELSPLDRTFLVHVPAAALRGDPGRWGYLVLVMGESRQEGNPPSPSSRSLRIFDVLDPSWPSQGPLPIAGEGERVELPMVHRTAAP